MKATALRRLYSDTQPSPYSKETRIVNVDIRKETRQVINEDGEPTGEREEVWSYIPIQIRPPYDYGHIKSQLIEAAYAQKDEFGLVMNAVGGILEAVDGSDSWKSFKSALMGAGDIRSFADFCHFREVCGAAAKEVVKAYG